MTLYWIVTYEVDFFLRNWYSITDIHCQALNPFSIIGSLDPSSGRIATTDVISMDLFRHEPLDTTRQQIRLMCITPEPSGPLNCQLIHVYLEDEKPPDYRAVSYEWGPPAPLRSVNINGKSLEVRQNLYAFLEAFRGRLFRFQGNSTYEAETQWLWIDQICINQAVIKERNHQVKMMSQIYSRAIYVYVWLGPSQVQVEEAMTVLKSGLRRYLEDRTIQTSTRKRERHQIRGQNETCNTESKPCSPPPPLPIDALRCFFENTYWQRLWIVQEIMLARYIRILCGDTLLSWDELRRFCLSGVAQLPAHAQSCVSPQMVWLTEHALSAKVYTYTDLLTTFSKSQCYDLKDKVYGLQGLIAPDMRVKVEYGKSVGEVFQDGVRLMCMDGTTATQEKTGDNLEQLDYDNPKEAIFQAISILKAKIESKIRIPLVTAIVELGNQMGLRLRPSHKAHISQRVPERILATQLEIVEFYTKQRLPALHTGRYEDIGRGTRGRTDVTTNLFEIYTWFSNFNCGFLEHVCWGKPVGYSCVYYENWDKEGNFDRMWTNPHPFVDLRKDLLDLPAQYQEDLEAALEQVAFDVVAAGKSRAG